MMTVAGLAIVIVIIAIVSILFKPSNSKSNPATADALSGAWVYDRYAKYESD